MEQKSFKAWLYLLPALLFLAVFMIYPLADVFIYSFEEGYNSASQTFFGVGTYNYEYILHDPYFLQAVQNTLLLVLCGKMRDTALGSMHTRTSEFLLCHNLAGHCLHHARTCEEHVRRILDHHGEICECRRIYGTTCARTEDSGNLRNHSGSENISLKDFSETGKRVDSLLDSCST